MSENLNKPEGGQDDPPGSSTEQAKASRETSPPRLARSTSAIPQLTRSRKGSREFSPTRNNALSSTLSTIPSAAAVQRALSAQRPPLPPSTTDGTSDTPRNDRTSFRSSTSSPSWPTSPRLKSPPPSTSTIRTPSARKNENESTPSNTSIKRLASTSGADATAATQTQDTPRDPPVSQTPARVPGRGASIQSSNLETVAESSVPTSPSIDPLRSPTTDSTVEGSVHDGADTTSQASNARDGEGSGDGDNADNAKKPSNPSASRPTTNMAKRSYASLVTPKPKAPEPPRTMTVETEPVTSMPQLLGGDRGLSGRDGNGSVRTKPSSETIRPKKEKKKSMRKAPSLQSGTATSKADLFEAKVANAVDEADTSDSDETFVYESNPPDHHTRRHHSRTPSGTSVATQDNHGRNRHGVRSGTHGVVGKKSTKFSNNTYGQAEDEDTAEGRGSTRTASTPRPHHIGRHGKAAHPSILDTNSPFTQASRTNSPRAANGGLARNSRPNSPRLSNGRLLPSPKKGDALDMYEDAADDERAPLMGSGRVTRSRHSKRPNGTALRQVGYFDDEAYDDHGHCRPFGGCFLLGLIVMLICMAVATFVVGLNQPLITVKVRHMQNILASEEELMLDLHVDAINTNIFAIAVNDLDVNIFAESAYAGTPSEWESGRRRLRWGRRQGTKAVADAEFHFPWDPIQPNDGVDEGTDPIDDPEPGMQKMLLGRVLEFDSPLVFDASPIRRVRSTSVGEIQLAKPGNQTEVGGSDRWERVLQHPFDLIVRGVIKYQLPLSSKTRSVKIASRANVKPDTEEGMGL